MITVETADSALKSYYLDAVTEALNLKTNPLLAQFKRSTADVVGKDVRKLVRIGINGGIGAGSETGDLPTARNSEKVEFVSTLKNLYGTIEISDKAVRASANNEGAFVNLLNDEMESLVKSASLNFGRMLFGDGTGYISVVCSAKDAKVYVNEITPFIEGMYIDFANAVGEPIPEAENVKIIHVNRQDESITLDRDCSAYLQEDGLIYVHGSRDYELTGLAAIFNEHNVLYGLDKMKYPVLRPYLENDFGEISENKIQKAIDDIEMNSGSQINFIVCSWDVKRALVDYYRKMSIVLPTMEIEGGYKALSFNGIPVVADRFCPKNTMFLLNTNDFIIHQLCDWKWLEGEDGKILKQVPGKPVYTATLVKYAELMCTRPNGQGMLQNIITE
jgi:hypothetical protein